MRNSCDYRPRSKTNRGHPKLKVDMPTDSTWVVSYSTFIDFIIVSVTVFEIQFLWSWTGTAQGVAEPMLIMTSKARRWFPSLWYPLCPTLCISHRIQDYDAKVVCHRSRRIHHRPRSKIMVPFESPWLVYDLLLVQHCIFSVLEIFDIKGMYIFHRNNVNIIISLVWLVETFRTSTTKNNVITSPGTLYLSLIHIWRCRRRG